LLAAPLRRNFQSAPQALQRPSSTRLRHILTAKFIGDMAMERGFLEITELLVLPM
jgi:hypothetical protein